VNTLNQSIIEIIIILLLLVANGIFAMSEMAVVAARKIRLQQLADSGNAQAQAALNLAEKPNQFLATVQVGITLVGILAGAFGGTTIARSIAEYLRPMPVVGPYNEMIGVGLVVIAITYLSLIMGELVPKRLALSNPERIASIIALPMQSLSRLALPAVRLLDISTNVIVRLLRVKKSPEPDLTLEEFKVLIEQGTEIGIIEKSEQYILKNVLRLDERPVSASMTPRPKIVWLDLEEPLKEIRRKVTEHHYSHFPVVQGGFDNIVGIITAKDFLVHCLTQPDPDLQTLLHPPLFIPESMSVLDVLEVLKREGTNIGLVFDEYGGIDGLVTDKDILKDIVGNIPAVGEPAEALEAIPREDGSWLVDGLLDIATLTDILGVEYSPSESDEKYQTVGGFVMSRISGVPTVGQYFEWQNFRFEVVDMDGRRVDKVLVTPLA